MIKISVITPSFNQGEFIGSTINSVEKQGIQELEHLVFDGGSQDQTVTLLEQQSPPLQWWSEPDRGQAHAVNKGLRQARGEVIAWINSDDVYYQGALAAVLRIFEDHPELDVVYGDADHINRSGIAFEPYPTMGWNAAHLRQTCFLCQPAVFFRRRVVERVGLLDESLRYCMDYEYWLRLADAGCSFRHVPIKLAGSRLYNENKTLFDRVAVHEEIANMFQTKYGSVPLKWVFAFCHYKVGQNRKSGALPRRLRYEFYLELIKAQWRWNRTIGFDAIRELRRQISRRGSSHARMQPK